MTHLITFGNILPKALALEIHYHYKHLSRNISSISENTERHRAELIDNLWKVATGCKCYSVVILPIILFTTM